MFNKCNIYSYCGLFLDDKMLSDLKIKKDTGFSIVFKLMNYSSVCTFNGEQVQKVNPNYLIELLSSEKNKNKEFFYHEAKNSFTLIPIQTYYGISGIDGNLITYYTDPNVRDAKIQLASRTGIQILTEDISKENNNVSQFNYQKRLRSVYNALDSENK